VPFFAELFFGPGEDEIGGKAEGRMKNEGQSYGSSLRPFHTIVTGGRIPYFWVISSDFLILIPPSAFED
jgi:hypothetical protein